MLPSSKQSRASQEITPLQARVMLAGMPKSGKTSLLAAWAPNTTLLIDTHRGTTLLEGEHYVSHIASWDAFVAVIDDVITDTISDKPRFETIGIDLIDDVWKFADAHAAGKQGKVAAGLIEYGKGTAEAEGLFRQQVGRLLATNLGVWFISHTDAVEEDKVTRYVPRLDKRVRTYVQGATHFVFLAETLGPKRVLHTAPTLRFEAGSRVPLPEPMDLDSRKLYAAMAAGLGVPKKKPEAKPTTEPEKVAA